MDDNRLEKWYRATVKGRVEQSQGVLEFPLRKSADGIHQEVHPEGTMTKTEYEVLSYDASQDTTEVRIRLWTGKTHQIRVTMAHIGHPLVHDPLYADAQEVGKSFALRAYRLMCYHMRTGKQIVVEV